MKFQSMILALALVILGSSGAAAVTVDHDAKANFAALKTYSWRPGTPAASPLNETRIHDAIDAELAAKGLKKVESGGDMIVVTHASSREEQRVNVQEYGYAGPYWAGYNRGITQTSVSVYTVRVGNLLVDILDGKTQSVIWRGEASDTASESAEKNASKIVKAAKKLFKKFPPTP